jgi:hypothetical protein
MIGCNMTDYDQLQRKGHKAKTNRVETISAVSREESRLRGGKYHGRKVRVTAKLLGIVNHDNYQESWWDDEQDGGKVVMFGINRMDRSDIGQWFDLELKWTDEPTNIVGYYVERL